MSPAKVSSTADTQLLSRLPDLQELWCHNSGGFCCFFKLSRDYWEPANVHIDVPCSCGDDGGAYCFLPKQPAGKCSQPPRSSTWGISPQVTKWGNADFIFFPQSELKSKLKKRQRSQVVCWGSSTFSTNAQIWYSLNLYSSCPSGLEDGGAIMKAFFEFALFTVYYAWLTWYDLCIAGSQQATCRTICWIKRVIVSGASQSQLGPGSGRPSACVSSWANLIEISSPETNCHNRDLMQMSPRVSVGKEKLSQR